MGVSTADVASTHLIIRRIRSGEVRLAISWFCGTTANLMNKRKRTEKMVPPAGFEPATPALRMRCSTNWAKAAPGRVLFALRPLRTDSAGGQVLCQFLYDDTAIGAAVSPVSPASRRSWLANSHSASSSSNASSILTIGRSMIPGQRALGEQRIGGDGAACDVGQRLEQGDDGADLVGALLRVAGVRPQTDFFWPRGALVSWPTMPST